MLTPEQRAERRLGIGGSDAAAVCGRHPRKSALSVWMEKAHGITRETTSEAMEWGNHLEPIIARVAAERLGKTLRVPTQTIVHPRFPWVRANLDGELDANELLETKCLNAFDAKELGPQGSDEIVRSHLYQVHHYLLTTGASVAHVAYLVGGNELRLFRVERDPEFEQLLCEHERRFWKEHVEAKEPPMEGATAEALDQYIAWRYAPKERATLTIDDSMPAVLGALTELRTAEAEAKAAEERRREAAQQVQLIMGDTTDLVSPVGKVLWRPNKTGVRSFNTYFKKEEATDNG